MPLQRISARQQPNSPDLAFKGNPFAQGLHKTNHAFAASPPLNIASELANADLSPTPGKTYSFPALAQTAFLGRSAQEPPSFSKSAAPGLNTSKLRRAKIPDFTKRK